MTTTLTVTALAATFLAGAFLGARARNHVLEDIVTTQAQFDAHVSTTLAQLTTAVDAAVAAFQSASTPAPDLDLTAFDSAVAEQVSRLTVLAGGTAPTEAQPVDGNGVPIPTPEPSTTPVVVDQPQA